MKKYALLGTVALILVTALVYLFRGGTTPTSSNKDVESVVSSFLNALTEGNIATAQTLAIGDTAQIIKSNADQKVKGKILDSTLTTVYSNDKFAQVEVDVSVSASTTTDRSHYLYYLLDTAEEGADASWKIFKIEDLPVTYQFDSTDQIDATATLNGYLQKVASADWNASLQYLSGTAYLQAQKTMNFLPKNFKSEIKLLKTETVVSESTKGLLKTTYELTIPNQPKQTVTSLFTVQKIGDVWKISDITNLSSK